MRKLFIVLAIVLFYSQNTAAQALSEEPMRFHKDYTENGLVIGSITFPEKKANFNGYYVKVENLSDDKKTARKHSREIGVRPNQITRLRHKGELEDGKTYLFAFETAPGQYNIPSVRFASIGFGGYVRDSGFNGFSIPFEVKKGEIVYIGEIMIDEHAHKGADSIINISDKFERDIQALKSRQKMINWNNAVKSGIKIIY